MCVEHHQGESSVYDRLQACPSALGDEQLHRLSAPGHAGEEDAVVRPATDVENWSPTVGRDRATATGRRATRQRESWDPEAEDRRGCPRSLRPEQRVFDLTPDNGPHVLTIRWKGEPNATKVRTQSETFRLAADEDATAAGSHDASLGWGCGQRRGINAAFHVRCPRGASDVSVATTESVSLSVEKRSRATCVTERQFLRAIRS